MLKILNNKYTKISIIFFIFLYFYITIDLNTLLIELKLLNKYYFLLSILLFFPNTFLLIYKWSLLTKKFKKFNLTSLYKQFTLTFFISDILHNPTLIEITKFFSLKKINYLERTAIIINDKIIIIVTKVFYTFFFILLINQNQIYAFILRIFNERKIYLLFIILSILIFIILKFRRYLLKYYKKYFSSKIIEQRKILLIEFIRNILMSCLYFLSFLQFTSVKEALLFAALSPLIETFIRLQFITTFGFRELILFLIGNYLGLDQNIILSSLFITFVTLSTSALNLLFSLFIGKSLREKKLNDNYINFIFIDKINRGNSDFYDAIKLISKNNKMIRCHDALNLNFKKIVIQENFVNPIYFIRLMIFCIFYNGKLFILLTEFFTKTKNSMSFNVFNKNEYVPNNFFLILLIIFCYKTLSLFGYRLERLTNMHYKAYHKLRYSSAMFFSRYAYGFVIAHPKIKVPSKISKNKKIIKFPYFFPSLKYDIKWQSKNCKFLLEHSGQLTNYRIKKFNSLKFNRKIFNFNQIKKLNKLDVNTFVNRNKAMYGNKICFSYHLEKNESWRYSSPTRYFNSFKNNKIPVVNRNFNDIYSDICLTKKIFNEKSRIQILKKVKKLNQKICQINNQSKEIIYDLVNF